MHIVICAEYARKRRGKGTPTATLALLFKVIAGVHNIRILGFDFRGATTVRTFNHRGLLLSLIYTHSIPQIVVLVKAFRKIITAKGSWLLVWIFVQDHQKVKYGSLGQ
jgi:hypothetical protein